MSGRGIALVLGTGAGAFFAAGLIQLATSPVAHAEGEDGPTAGLDPDFMDKTISIGPITDIAAADPDDHEYVATVLQTPLFTDVLTSGEDLSNSFATLPGVPADTGVGMAGETVNTFMVPAVGIDSTFILPFTDPLADIFTALVPLGF
ncbi:MAG TPA: hypothetical protein VEF72_20700 [Mycobacterium sp.]|nr:hypothetical protein [Mycobacterium sp.]